MASIVASRFAVLCVDDDDDDDTLYCTKKKKTQNKKIAVKCQNSVPTKPEPNQKKKKKQENHQVQNVKKSKQLNTAVKSKKKKEINCEQWEEWKERDDQFMQGNFEEQLSKAILLSKIDYERRKEQDKSAETEVDKPENEKKKKKSQKVMSLSEFNNLNSKNSTECSKSKTPKTEKEKEKQEVFKSPPEKNLKKEISNENASIKKKSSESTSQEALTLVLYQASLDKKDREIGQLKEEIERLHTQLTNVKTRNTKLCQIIASGEMKDKAEVLMEVERLQTIKDELSTEVASLHSQLEQERSKVRQLTAESKNKNKKH